MKSIKSDPPLESTSKERILNAAQAIFAQKGFEGARVDEIARQAGVNKALIYYYFKSKEEILLALIQLTVHDLMLHMGDPSRQMEEWLGSEELMHGMMLKLLMSIEEKKDLLNIFIMELFKDSERRKLILSHIGDELQKSHVDFYTLVHKGESHESLVFEFFTGLVPIIMFVLLKEPWKQLYEQDEVELRNMFIKAFKATHLHHAQHLIESAQSGNGEEGALER
jgi:TetR/AcrR family transcriptional regulator